MLESPQVVKILEEVVEIQQSSLEVLNYMVVVEQARMDLKGVASMWKNYEKRTKNAEYFSDMKLFYFIY